MKFKRAVGYLSKDLERARSRVGSTEHAIDYHMKEIVYEQEKLEAYKLDIQNISEELWLLQQLQGTQVKKEAESEST